MFSGYLTTWVVHSQFGKPGTQYDFTSIDYQSLQMKAVELEKSQEGMKKKINPKVMNMIDR